MIDFTKASINRQQAIKTGDKFYFGRDCKKQHGGKRYTKQRVCYQCMLDQSNKWHASRAVIAADLCQNSNELVETDVSEPPRHRYAGNFGE